MSLTDETLQRLGKRSRQGGIISLIGVGLVVAAIGASMWELGRLRADIQAQTKVRDGLQAEVDALTAKRKQLTNQLATLQDSAGRTALAVQSGDLGLARKTLEQQARTAPAGPAVRRVYFQIRSEEQRGLYQRCKGALTRQGYRVPDVQLLPDKGPKVSTIRFFHGSDAQAAGQLASAMKGCGVAGPKVEPVKGFDAVVPPGQFEVWFAPYVKPPSPTVSASPSPTASVSVSASASVPPVPSFQTRVIFENGIATEMRMSPENRRKLTDAIDHARQPGVREVVVRSYEASSQGEIHSADSARKRAEKVKEAFLKAGVKATITTQSFGKAATEAAKAPDREHRYVTIEVRY